MQGKPEKPAWQVQEILRGVKLNLSKSGVSGTFGVEGGSVNIGKDGTYLNTGIPGTGIYDRKKLGSSADSSNGGTFETDTGEAGPDLPPPKIGPLGMLGGFLALGGLVAFILLLFFPGWPRRLVAAAVFILGGDFNPDLREAGKGGGSGGGSYHAR